MSVETKRLERREKIGVIGRLTIMRHGETTYSEQFPDLTDKGVEQARSVADL